MVPLGPTAKARGVFRRRKRSISALLEAGSPRIFAASRIGALCAKQSRIGSNDINKTKQKAKLLRRK
jgi:hypothetical protein